MNTNLKPLALAFVVGLTLVVCADEPACTPKENAPAPIAESATAPATEPPAVIIASEPTMSGKPAKRRRTRGVKKGKATAPVNGKQKTSRRRTRKMESAELPVTGMLDSAE